MRKVLIGVVAATMVVAACGGSSKKGIAAGDTGTTAGAGGGNGDIADFANARLKITYADTSPNSGTLTASTVTVAQDGKGRSSFSTSDADSSAGSTIYSDGKSTVTCTGAGSTAHCTALPTATASPATSITASFAALASALAKIGGGDKSSENIAGRNAQCVKYKAADVVGRLASLPVFKDTDEKPSDYDPTDTVTVCTDRDAGLVLKISGTKKGVDQDGLVATAVGEPTDADFTPPVTPQTLPSIPKPSAPNVSVPSNEGQ